MKQNKGKPKKSKKNKKNPMFRWIKCFEEINNIRYTMMEKTDVPMMHIFKR